MTSKEELEQLQAELENQAYEAYQEGDTAYLSQLSAQLSKINSDLLALQRQQLEQSATIMNSEQFWGNRQRQKGGQDSEEVAPDPPGEGPEEEN
jgi:hypothetical protein